MFDPLRFYCINWIGHSQTNVDVAYGKWEGHPDKHIVCIVFSYFFTKTYVVGIHKKRLGEVHLMSIRNSYVVSIHEKRLMSTPDEPLLTVDTVIRFRSEIK